MEKIERYRITNITEVEELYRTIELAIQSLSNTSTALIKRKNWIAVCFHECLMDFSQISSAFQKYSYKEVVSLSWNETEQSGFVVPTDEDNMGICFFWAGTIACVIFAGQPDWIILYERTLDYLLICGEEDFVEELIGCSKDEAFASIEEVIAESRFISGIGKQHFKDLLHKLRVVYPNADPGSKITFEFT
jgi:hypothetical protein